MTVNAVLQIKDPQADPISIMQTLAEFALEQFGKGGNTDADRIENYLGYVQTPVFGTYFTVQLDAEFGRSLEVIGETADVRLIRVEWPFDSAGNTIEYAPIYYPVDTVNNGVVSVTQQQIGSI